MFSVFCKRPILVKYPLRELMLQTTNESIKRQIDLKENQKFQDLITSSFTSLEDSNNPNNPGDDNNTIISYVIGFLSLSSILYYFYFKKR